MRGNDSKQQCYHDFSTKKDADIQDQSYAARLFISYPFRVYSVLYGVCGCVLCHETVGLVWQACFENTTLHAEDSEESILYCTHTTSREHRTELGEKVEGSGVLACHF